MAKTHGRIRVHTFVAVAVAIGAVVVASGIVTLKLFKQPFKTVTVDRTPPVVLNRIRDLAEYKAASGNFEVLVDVEKDVKYLPKAVAGERTFFVGVGTVDATVDFSKLSDAAISAAPDHSLATIVLPHAELKPATVDPAASHVAARSRGILNRVAGVFDDSPTTEHDLYVAAAGKMDAAASSTGLQAKAEDNTRAMLTSLVHSLGFQNVIVRFEADPTAG